MKHVKRLTAGLLTTALIGLIVSVAHQFESPLLAISIITIGLLTIYGIGAIVIAFINMFILKR